MAGNGDELYGKPLSPGQLLGLYRKMNRREKDYALCHLSPFPRQKPYCSDRLVDLFFGVQIAHANPNRSARKRAQGPVGGGGAMKANPGQDPELLIQAE